MIGGDLPAGDVLRRDSSAQRIDAACDRFEVAWREGRDPRIEEWVGAAAEPDRPALLRELIALEVELRRGRGEDPAAREYRDRFPGRTATVDAAFAVTAPRPGAGRPRTGRTRTDTSRDLLLGLLALQNNFIDRDALLAAFNTWVADRSCGLGRILLKRGALSPGRHTLLQALVAEHIRLHGDDPERSLRALSPIGPVRDDLSRVADPQLEASLLQISAAREDDGADSTASFAGVDDSSPAGTRFRLLRLHAKGGLGAVFVALDTELHREVALKQILERHADDPMSRARFLLEAEITGGLEHPGIVPVYGLGHDPDGRPFYAMRFIRGDSLKDAIAGYHSDVRLKRDPGRSSLELRKLLRRFLDVCNAIDYAHSRGVLHRDLKPGNIIVGKHGETLVVDWGLAKPVGRAELGSASEERTLVPSSASGSAETLPGMALGTPAFMSPEQAAGDLDRLGPPSDVYSLGASLYCLLLGRAPFEGDDIEGVLRAVRKGDFPPPRQLDPSIDRALEATCLKAMALRPEDRYASPRALAEDLERWAAGESVSAYRDPLHVRAWRRVSRHRTLVTSVAAATLVAIIIMAGATLLLMAVNRQEREARAEADANFRRTLEVLDRMSLQVGDDLLVNLPRAKPVREQLLGEARDLLEQLLKERPGDPAVRLLAGRFYARHDSKFHRDLNQLAAAEQSLRRGIDLLAALGGGPHAGPRACTELAYAYSMLGYILRDRGRLGEAGEMGRRSVDLLDVAVARSPDPAPYLPELGSALLRQGRILADLGHGRDAEAAFLRSLEVFEGLTEAHPDDARYRQGCARILHFLGWFREEHGRYREAERDYGRARDLREGLVKEFPGVVSYRYDLGDTYNNLIVVMRNLMRVEEAERYFDRLYRLEKGLAEEFPERPVYRAMLGLAQVNLGGGYLNAGRPMDRARELLEAGIAELRAAIALAGEADLMHRRWLADAYCSQVKVFARLGQFSHLDAATRELLKNELPRGQHLYLAACALGYAAPRVRESATLRGLHLQRIVLALFYRARAMNLLRDAAERGFATAARLKSDTDLDDLRALSEYRTLLARLEQPEAKSQPPDQ
jgi:serine/threonine-protein kinase